MSDLKLLLECRTEALGAIRGSTASEIVQDAMCAYFDRALDVAAGRAAVARERSLERSAAIRAAILQAGHGLPVGVWGEAGIVQRRIERRPEFYGLQRVPDIDTIRKHLRGSILEPGNPPALFVSTR